MPFTYKAPHEGKCEIETPPAVAEYLYRLLKHLKPNLILDPCAGLGNLLKPWNCRKIGIEKDEERFRQLAASANPTYILSHSTFETTIIPHTPDLILCNPPWNRHWKGKNYAEIFMRRILDHGWDKIPMV